MRFKSGLLAAAGILFVTGFGYYVTGDWYGALIGFVGFVIGGFVAATQLRWKLQAMRRGE